MRPSDKPLVWLAGEVKTPPLSTEARIEAGFLLRRLQQGEFPIDATLAADVDDRAELPRAEDR